jgi:hypothetical protein
MILLPSHGQTVQFQLHINVLQIIRQKGATSLIHTGQPEKHRHSDTQQSGCQTMGRYASSIYSKHKSSNLLSECSKSFTQGMSKRGSSPPTALGRWRPSSSLRTHQSGGLSRCNKTLGNMEMEIW